MSDQTEAELEKTRQVVAEMSAEQSAAADGVLETEPEPEAADEVVEGWDAYTKEELVEELRNRELPVSGTKDELVARLNEDDA